MIAIPTRSMIVLALAFAAALLSAGLGTSVRPPLHGHFPGPTDSAA